MLSYNNCCSGHKWQKFQLKVGYLLINCNILVLSTVITKAKINSFHIILQGMRWMSPKFGSKFSNYFAAQANCNFLIATERTSIGYSKTTNLGLALLDLKTYLVASYNI